MFEFLLKAIFWTLAIYGLYEIVKNIIYIFTYTKLRTDGIYVILIYNQQMIRKKLQKNFQKNMIF